MLIKIARKQIHLIDLFVHFFLIIFFIWLSLGIGISLGEFIASFTASNNNMEKMDNYVYRSNIKDLIEVVQEQIKQGKTEAVIAELETLLTKLPNACKDGELTTDELCLESAKHMKFRS